MQKVLASIIQDFKIVLVTSQKVHLQGNAEIFFATDKNNYGLGLYNHCILHSKRKYKDVCTSTFRCSFQDKTMMNQDNTVYLLNQELLIQRGCEVSIYDVCLVIYK
jgi:hypothetical protein